MPSDAVLFIDANPYLLLYGMVAGKKLLDSLEEQKEYIILPKQVADEVDRNKLEAAARFFAGQFEKLSLSQIGVPDHLFGVSDEKTSLIRSELQGLRRETSKAKDELTNLAT